MLELDKLLERMRRVEALYARTDVDGEKAAAGQALQAILAQVQRQRATDPAVEYKFKLGDNWNRRLFMALARRYQLEPYRYRGQRHSTVMLRVPKSFVDSTLWPEFQELSRLLATHLMEVTNKIISDALNASGSDDTAVQEGTAAAISGPDE